MINIVEYPLPDGENNLVEKMMKEPGFRLFRQYIQTMACLNQAKAGEFAALAIDDDANKIQMEESANAANFYSRILNMINDLENGSVKFQHIKIDSLLSKPELS